MTDNKLSADDLWRIPRDMELAAQIMVVRSGPLGPDAPDDAIVTQVLARMSPAAHLDHARIGIQALPRAERTTAHAQMQDVRPGEPMYMIYEWAERRVRDFLTIDAFEDALEDGA